MLDVIEISDAEFQLFRDLVYERFGIFLSEQKRALVVGRLNKLLRQGGLDSFQEYYDRVISDRSGKTLSNLVDRISTNHTYFYREADHFEFLSQTVLPQLTRVQENHGDRLLRLWCAASASGEEPYTLAMLLLEHLGDQLQKWDVGVLATDISRTVLEQAITGIYGHNNVNRLPETLREKYLKRVGRDAWQVRDEVKDLVLFRRLNLVRDNYPFRGKFHIVFARNVMIYFDEPTRSALIERFHRYTYDGGYLFIGHSETLGGSNKLYRFLKPAVYRKDATA